MRLLGNLKIVWKIGLIVAVLGCALIGVVVFGSVQLTAIVEDYAELSAVQSAALDLSRAQRRAETYHAALYAVLTETTDEGNAKRLKTATRAATGFSRSLTAPSRNIRR